MLISKLHCFSNFYQRPLISILFSAFIYKENKNNVNLLIQKITVDNITSINPKKNNTENFISHVFKFLQWARKSK